MHANHIEQLDNFNDYIKQLGEKPIKYQSTGEMSPELIAIKEGMSDEEIINVLRKNEQVINNKLHAIIDEVQIPEIAHDIEEDIDDEEMYIETLKDYME
jgi:type III secretion system FlhB-like substrate exporter